MVKFRSEWLNLKIMFPGTKLRPGFILFEWVRMQVGVSLSDTTEHFDEDSSLVAAEHLFQVSLSDVMEEFSGCDALMPSLPSSPYPPGIELVPCQICIPL